MIPQRKESAMAVNGIANLQIIEDPDMIRDAKSPKGKAFIRVEFEDGQKVAMTLTLAEMIGGAAQGVQRRLGYVKEH